MDEVNKIRKAVLSKGESRNSVAKKFNRSWETVDRIVSIPREELKNRGQRRSREGNVVTEAVRLRIEFELSEEVRIGVRSKQKWRARTLFNKLKGEGVYGGSERRFQEVFKEIRQGLGVQPVKSYLPLEFDLGEALQVDHGEADVLVGGQRYSVYLFVTSVPGHLFRFAQAYPLKAMEAWGEFHNEAFEFYGGVFPKAYYDNDSVLVKAVMGSERDQTEFSLSLQEHFDFEAVFCNRAAGWEKGSVENAVGYMRRNHLAGLPSFESFAELNSYLKTCSMKELESTEKASELKACLDPLPEAREWEKDSSLHVNSYQLVTHEGHEYSVPERYVGQYLEARLSIFRLCLYCNGELVVSHSRCFKTDEHRLELDHYLEPLLRKPAGLAHCRAMKGHSFSPEAQELWRRLLSKYDSRQANKEFIRALILRRRSSSELWKTAVSLAIVYGSIESEAIANILHQTQTPTLEVPTDWLQDKLPHLMRKECHFDLSIYADLSQGVCHAH